MRDLKHILLLLTWYDYRLHRGAAEVAREAGWHLICPKSVEESRRILAGWQGDGCVAVYDHPKTLARSARPADSHGRVGPHAARLPRATRGDGQSGHRAVGRPPFPGPWVPGGLRRPSNGHPDLRAAACRRDRSHASGRRRGPHDGTRRIELVTYHRATRKHRHATIPTPRGAVDRHLRLRRLLRRHPHLRLPRTRPASPPERRRARRRQRRPDQRGPRRWA
jgi:hypothetical protein